MYKEMIPADVIARESSSRSRSQTANAFPAFRGSPTPGDSSIQKELMECKERCLRLAADFDHFKKRADRESADRAVEFVNELKRGNQIEEEQNISIRKE